MIEFIRKPLVKYGLAAITGTGVLAFLLFTGMKIKGGDERNGLCISCHDMKETVYKEYLTSVHNKNASGMSASCNSCHLPPDTGAAAVRKIKAAREVVATIKGTINTPEKFEANRLRMAKNVWADMEASNSRECRTCHREESFDYTKFKKKDDAKRMKKGLDEGQTCISCHKGVAHEMPDMASGFKSLYQELAEKPLKEKKNTHAYTLGTKPFFTEKGDSKPSGKILPGTEVTILKAKGDKYEIRIDGWQQDGVDAIIYAMKGKRIFYAAISKKARALVEKKESVVDPDTDLTWNRVSITGYVKKDLLVADRDDIWNYGREMWSASCSSCHSATPPGHFSANLWIGNLKSMKPQLSLTKEEYRFLQTYLQFHASDTGGKGH